MIICRQTAGECVGAESEFQREVPLPGSRNDAHQRSQHFCFLDRRALVHQILSTRHLKDRDKGFTLCCQEKKKCAFDTGGFKSTERETGTGFIRDSASWELHMCCTCVMKQPHMYKHACILLHVCKCIQMSAWTRHPHVSSWLHELLFF